MLNSILPLNNKRKRGVASHKVHFYLVPVMLLLLVLSLSGCSNSAEVSKLTDDNQTLLSQNQKLQAENLELQAKVQELQAKVDEAKPWFEMSEQDKKAKEAELKRIQEAEEKAAKDKAEAERLAKEAEEKKGYNTGIKYSQLARTPDAYVGKKVKFRGEVVQVIEGKGETELRIAVNSDYDSIIYASYNSDIVSSRVLENDIITVMGVSDGLISYQSTMGGTITIPSMLVEKIDF